MNKYILSIGNSINGEKDWSLYFGNYKSNLFCQYTHYPLRGDVVIYYTIYVVSQVLETPTTDSRRLAYGTAQQLVDYLKRQCPAVPIEFSDEFLQKTIQQQRNLRITKILG